MFRGEVWLASLDPTIGVEIRKTRPVVIMSRSGIGVLPLKVIVPITDWKDAYRPRVWMIRLDPNVENGLEKVSAADTFQVRSIAQVRLIRKLGVLSETEMDAIAEALSIVLDI
jgi:mRNA interferase MazF